MVWNARGGRDAAAHRLSSPTHGQFLRNSTFSHSQLIYMLFRHPPPPPNRCSYRLETWCPFLIYRAQVACRVWSRSEQNSGFGPLSSRISNSRVPPTPPSMKSEKLLLSVRNPQFLSDSNETRCALVFRQFQIAHQVSFDSEQNSGFGPLSNPSFAWREK